MKVAFAGPTTNVSAALIALPPAKESGKLTTYISDPTTVVASNMGRAINRSPVIAIADGSSEIASE